MINKYSIIEPKGKHESLVVFLHGLGSNKDDLIALGDIFSTALPNAIFVSPNACQDCEFVPNGYQWFQLYNCDMEGINNCDSSKLDMKRLRKEVSESISELNQFIDNIMEEKQIPAENLYLVGFSQGATMSVYTAINRETPVKAVLAYSGILFDNEISKIKSKPKIVGLSHGKLDDVVSFNWHKQNIDSLIKHNIEYKELVSDFAFHEIPEKAIAFGLNILKESI
ncbi:MAG: dienelactone hydrolase family protein [Alphaproteobacteria bacterium]|jgi:phospholipase/carboxylesterase|nr:dienelactone hydrolase family protein [Alphaproteobacteria bacterium]